MLKNALIEKGVEADAIHVVPDEQEAMDTALRLAAAGDLVMAFGDDVKRCWKQIIYFEAGSEAEKPKAAPRVDIPLEDLEAFDLDADVELIRDERGVRIAREAGD